MSERITFLLRQGNSMHGGLSVANSLQRRKRKPEYRALLRHAIQVAGDQELRAISPSMKMNARQLARIARVELLHLTSGGAPDPYSGYILLRAR